MTRPTSTLTPSTLVALATLAAALVLAGGCQRERAAPRVPWPGEAPACAPPTASGAAWRHDRSAVVARMGEPRHVASDVVVPARTRPELVAKFAYGKVSKDLEGEDVDVYLAGADCAVRRLGRTGTDDDGRAGYQAPALPPGHHRYWMRVAGDGSAAEGGVWVLPGATPAVVFDVDGTLTIDDGELLDDLLGRGAEAFAGAAAVARAWADKGYLVVYVTGRPYPLRELTRRWLVAGGFPFGPLFTPDRLRDGRPSRDGVGAFKRETLIMLQAAGLRVVRAYGNAATDVCAYAEAGILPAATFIVGTPTPCDAHPLPHALPGYVDHLADVEAQPAAATLAP